MDLPHALTIAGSDSGGGAGIQADLKTFSALGVFGTSAITAITVQNTISVQQAFELSPDLVAAQIDAVFSDIRIDAVKIGMISSQGIIAAVAECLKKWRPESIVLDPVMVSKSGCNLLRPEALESLKSSLVPMATLVTPNVPEAELLTDMKIVGREDMERAGRKLLSQGAGAALVKGGHCVGHADDILVMKKGVAVFHGERIDSRNTHGTGCTLSSAIASFLAKGESLVDACRHAKDYLRRAIGAGLEIGHGCGPVHHFVDWY